MNSLFAKGIVVTAIALLAASNEHVIPNFNKLKVARIKSAVLVPTVVPALLGKTYADGIADSMGGYEIDLDRTPNCNGAGACSSGYITGQLASHDPPAGYHPVRLSDGTSGYYIDHGCGANCDGSFEFLFFRGNTKYTIFLNGGTVADALLIQSEMKPL